MQREQAWTLISTARVATLATLRPDGSPRLVPCVFAIDGDTLHIPVDDKPKRTRTLARLNDISRDGRVGLLVHGFSEDWAQLWWVRLDGDAAVTAGKDLTVARTRLLERYPQYTAASVIDPVITVKVTAWRGWRADEAAR